MERQLFEEKLTYIHKHEWDAHQLSIEQCKSLGNQQAAYFIQRDLTFRQDVIQKKYFHMHFLGIFYSMNQFFVIILNHLLSLFEQLHVVDQYGFQVKLNKKTFVVSSILFLENWIIERTYPLPIERIPTQFAKYTYTSDEEERRTRLINSDVNSVSVFSILIIRFSSLKHDIIFDEK
jgi:hypothetical protein